MSLAMNALWLLTSGWIVGLTWYLAGILCAMSIILLPFTRACFRIGTYSFMPFGKDVVDAKDIGEATDKGQTMGTVLNVVWFLIGGWYIALAHAILGLIAGVTVIGIPWAIAHFKLAGVAMFPAGKRVVPAEVAQKLRDRKAEEFLNNKLNTNQIEHDKVS